MVCETEIKKIGRIVIGVDSELSADVGTDDPSGRVLFTFAKKGLSHVKGSCAQGLR